MRIDPIAASPRVHRHVFHSARSFTDDGLLAFDPDRYAVPSSIAFIEGDGGEGGAGGTGGSDGNAGGGAPKTLTQEQVNGLLAKERKSWEAKLASATGEATSKLQAELDALKIAQEEAGKSATEKAQAAAARERAVLEQKLGESNKALEAREAVVLARTQELRDTRLDHELVGLLGAAKVLPQAMRAATLVFRADAKIEYDADGNVEGVDLGTGRYPTVAAALAEWMKTNGDIYVAAPAGGAGLRAGNAGGGSNKPAYLRTTEENLALANERRSRGR